MVYTNKAGVHALGYGKYVLPHLTQELSLFLGDAFLSSADGQAL